MVCRLIYASTSAIAAAKGKNKFQEDSGKIADGEAVSWWILISYWHSSTPVSNTSASEVYSHWTCCFASYAIAISFTAIVFPCTQTLRKDVSCL